MPFPLNEDELKKTEKEIGAELPTSYREAMMKDNGGSVDVRNDDWDLFPVRNQSSRKLIARTANHILRETKSAREWRGYPESALAIGGNGSGDLLVFIKEGSIFNPEVVIWGHEDGSLEPEANDFSKLEKA